MAICQLPPDQDIRGDTGDVCAARLASLLAGALIVFLRSPVPVADVAAPPQAAAAAS